MNQSYFIVYTPIIPTNYTFKVETKKDKYKWLSLSRVALDSSCYLEAAYIMLVSPTFCA